MEEVKLARAETLVVGMPVVVRGGVADNNRAAEQVAVGLLRIQVVDISRRAIALRHWANRIPVASRVSRDRSRTDMLLKLRHVLEQVRHRVRVRVREEFNPVVGELAPIPRAQRAESTEESPAWSITIGQIVVEFRTAMLEQAQT